MRGQQTQLHKLTIKPTQDQPKLLPKLRAVQLVTSLSKTSRPSKKLRGTPETSREPSTASHRSTSTQLLFKEQVGGVFIPLWLITPRTMSSRRSSPRVQELYCSPEREQALLGKKGCCKHRSCLGTKQEGSPAISCC